MNTKLILLNNHWHQVISYNPTLQLVLVCKLGGFTKYFIDTDMYNHACLDAVLLVESVNLNLVS